MSNTVTHRSSAWFAIGALALAGLVAGCDRRGPGDTPPSTTTSPSATTPMPPASAASR